MLKVLNDIDSIVDVGIPEDYKNNTEILDRIVNYAQFVQQQVYVLNLTDAFYNIVNTNKFSELYIDDAWLENISTKADRSRFTKGIFFELRKILNLSNSVEEAEEKIIDFWLNNSKIGRAHV